MAWHPTYYALRLNDPNGTTVLVPSFGIFATLEDAQAKADASNDRCPGQMSYSVVPVSIIEQSPAFTAAEIREAFNAQS